MPEETREIRVPLAVTVGEREIEIPVQVPVTFAALVGVVERHLETGEELHGLLLEHYADRLAPRAAPNRRDTANRGTDTRRKAEATDEAFSPGEIVAWRGKPAPGWSGKGRKSRERRLWEAANPEQAAGNP